jgi:Fe-S-cluster containining protein
MDGASLNMVAGGRKCDGCTACCFTHAVAEVKTHAGEWCSHCDAGAGCRIYLQRPEQCRRFSCLWLRGGWGDEHDRPDRLKVVVDGIAVTVRDRQVRLVQFIETEAGALDQERVAELVEMFKAKGVGLCTARLLPSGEYADASYEIPTSLLAEDELELFKEGLSKLGTSTD